MEIYEKARDRGNPRLFFRLVYVGENPDSDPRNPKAGGQALCLAFHQQRSGILAPSARSSLSVFWIRFEINTDQDPAFYVNTDPDRDFRSGTESNFLKIKKIILTKKLQLLLSQIAEKTLIRTSRHK